VCLTARDSGTGMEPEVIEHAFEPFFTTKPFAEGGGLGLASVYGITRQAGGTAAISSAPGTGTTVTVWLPAAIPGHPAGSPANVALTDRPAHQAAPSRTIPDWPHPPGTA